jgi:hypothetical protein
MPSTEEQTTSRPSDICIDPNNVDYDPSPNSVYADPDPDSVYADPDPDSVYADPDPDSIYTNPDTDTVYSDFTNYDNEAQLITSNPNRCSFTIRLCCKE